MLSPPDCYSFTAISAIHTAALDATTPHTPVVMNYSTTYNNSALSRSIMGVFFLAEAEGYSSLQEAGVRLISHETCKKPEVYGNHVTDNMLCAGLNGCADACQVGRNFQHQVNYKSCFSHDEEERIGCSRF